MATALTNLSSYDLKLVPDGTSFKSCVLKLLHEKIKHKIKKKNICFIK